MRAFFSFFTLLPLNSSSFISIYFLSLSRSKVPTYRVDKASWTSIQRDIYLYCNIFWIFFSFLLFPFLLADYKAYALILTYYVRTSTMYNVSILKKKISRIGAKEEKEEKASNQLMKFWVWNIWVGLCCSEVFRQKFCWIFLLLNNNLSNYLKAKWQGWSKKKIFLKGSEIFLW